MAPARTISSLLSCPTCGRPDSRVVAMRSGTEPGMPCEARVHECVACWSRRARAIGAARAKLRATGELAETADGRMTWLGVPVSEDSDPVSCAIGSELLRMGFESTGPRVMRLAPAELDVLVEVPAE